MKHGPGTVSWTLDAVGRCRGALRGLGLALLLSSDGLGAGPTAATWQEVPGGRWRRLPTVPPSPPGFTHLLPEATGVTFTNLLRPESEAANHNLLNGAGLALADADGDGWCDIFLCGLDSPSRLYRNLGQWRFEDVTSAAGLGEMPRYARGAVFAEVDGDGHPDLLVSFSGLGVRVYLNDGAGRFREAPAPELRANTGSTSLALADVDGDGDLDLYVTNYGENTIRSGARIATRMVGGTEQVIGRYRHRLKIIGGKLVEYGEPDVLYLNDGQGRFHAVSWTGGVFRDETGQPLAAAPWDLGLSAVFHDVNGDTHPDLYVCNDFQDPDRFWINDGRGGFQALPRVALRSTPHFSMAAAFADLDRDGRDELTVVDMLSPWHRLRMTQSAPDPPPIEHTREREPDRPQNRRNYLFWNRGDGTFADVAFYAGVAASDWSWTVTPLDADLDGYEDLFITNGHPYDTQDLDAIARTRQFSPAQRRDGRVMLDTFPPLRTPNRAYRNRGDLTFEEVGSAWGFAALEVSHGLALADLDNDGDLDLVLNCLNAPARLYRNNAAAPRVAVQLKGLPPNPHGIGARLILRHGAVQEQRVEMAAGGRYLSGDQPVTMFAAGSPSAVMELEARWRSGRVSLLADVRAGRLYEVDEAGARPASPPVPAAVPLAWFEDRSATLAHRHVEPAFDDFERQPLLPHKLSQAGPVVAWADLNGDGAEDLVIGASRHGRPALFLNDGKGNLQSAPVRSDALPDDLAAWAVWPRTDGLPALLAAVASYESELMTNPPLWTLRFEGGTGIFHAGPPLRPLERPARFNAAALCLGDLDGDGVPELFVGGRCQSGAYPMALPSRLFRAGPEGWEEIPGAAEVLAHVGLINDAVMADLPGEGRAVLALACEWGPVRVFRWTEGRLREVTTELGFSDRPGLWQSVAVGDFDGDGRLDLVTGNWGLNSRFQITRPGPWFLYHGDFFEDGTRGLIEAWQEPGSGRILPWLTLSLLERNLPGLRVRYPTHHAFASATVPEILGDFLPRVERLTVNTLASMLWLNRGERFEPRPLPPAAQWAPVFGLAAADFDGDGAVDLFLAQNFFGVPNRDSRLDSGRGLLLQGDGRGGFRPLSGSESGIVLYGEQRGCAVADFDGDGRPDLCVAQNGDRAGLFRNRIARPGLRVRLIGPPGNPAGVGARLRARCGNHWGPVHAVTAGGGYGSQPGLVSVLAASSPPSHVQVHWPGGRLQEIPVPSGVRELTVTWPRPPLARE